MSDLPLGWASTTVREVSAAMFDGPFGSALKTSDYTDSGVRVARLENIGHLAFRGDLKSYVSAAKGQQLSRHLLRAADILFSSFVDRQTRVCLVPDDLDGSMINKADCFCVRVDPKVCDPRLLAYRLAAPSAYEAFAGSVKGVTRPRIGMRDLAAFKVELPPIAEQRRIVTKLDALTTRTARARADLDRVSAMAARYKSAILAKAICGELTSEWRRGRDLSPVVTILTTIREGRSSDRRLSRRSRVSSEPEFDLPPTWAWVSPDELADDETYSIGIGPFGSNLVQADYQESGVRLIFVRDIRRGCFDSVGARYVTQEKAAALHQHTVIGGELLITKMGDPPGDTVLYPLGAGLAVITADCVKLKPHPLLASPQFLAFAIRADVVKTQLAEITAGVAQQKISLERFRNIALPVPPLEEQHEIVRRIDRAFAEIDRLTTEATAARLLLDRLDQAILAKAFQGELVPQDPADERASVLLDRIHAKRVAALAEARRVRHPQTN